jgi:hypothetical protein
VRIITFAAAGTAAAAMLMTATSAYAAEATLKASSTTVYQGGKVYLSEKCENPSYYPVLTSKLFSGGARTGTPGHTNYTLVVVSKTKTPGTYTIKLSCESLYKGVLGHTHGTSTVDVTVLKATSKTSPSEIASSGGTSFGATTAVIETGFGGMAASVALHHPAR